MLRGALGVMRCDDPSFQIIALPTRVPVRPLLQTMEAPFCVQTVCAITGFDTANPSAIKDILIRYLIARLSIVRVRAASPAPFTPSALPPIATVRGHRGTLASCQSRHSV